MSNSPESSPLGSNSPGSSPPGSSPAGSSPLGRRSRNGFTLLELLVALTVFGLLLAGLSRTLSFGLAAWQQGTRLSAGHADLEAADRGLRLIVENLAPQTDDSEAPPLTGGSDRLVGQGRLRTPQSGAESVPVEVGLALSGNRLVLRWRPYHHGVLLQPPPPPGEVTLARHVSRLAIAYWGPSGVWTSRWDQPQLPFLIRFRIGLGDAADASSEAPSPESPPSGSPPSGSPPSGSHWPDIVIAPKLSHR